MQLALVIEFNIMPHLLTLLLQVYFYIRLLQVGGKKYPQGISASMRVRNIFPTATPMFSGSSNSMEIL